MLIPSVPRSPSGALVAGDLADFFGRRITIISGCMVFFVGVALQTASHGLGLLVAGRLVAGVGIGFVSAIIILYSELFSLLPDLCALSQLN